MAHATGEGAESWVLVRPSIAPFRPERVLRDAAALKRQLQGASDVPAGPLACWALAAWGWQRAGPDAPFRCPACAATFRSGQQQPAGSSEGAGVGPMVVSRLRDALVSSTDSDTDPLGTSAAAEHIQQVVSVIAPAACAHAPMCPLAPLLWSSSSAEQPTPPSVPGFAVATAAARALASALECRAVEHLSQSAHLLWSVAIQLTQSDELLRRLISSPDAQSAAALATSAAATAKSKSSAGAIACAVLFQRTAAGAAIAKQLADEDAETAGKARALLASALAAAASGWTAIDDGLVVCAGCTAVAGCEHEGWCPLRLKAPDLVACWCRRWADMLADPVATTKREAAAADKLGSAGVPYLPAALEERVAAAQKEAQATLAAKLPADVADVVAQSTAWATKRAAEMTKRGDTSVVLSSAGKAERLVPEVAEVPEERADVKRYLTLRDEIFAAAESRPEGAATVDGEAFVKLESTLATVVAEIGGGATEWAIAESPATSTSMDIPDEDVAVKPSVLERWASMFHFDAATGALSMSADAHPAADPLAEVRRRIQNATRPTAVAAAPKAPQPTTNRFGQAPSSNAAGKRPLPAEAPKQPSRPQPPAQQPLAKLNPQAAPFNPARDTASVEVGVPSAIAARMARFGNGGGPAQQQQSRQPPTQIAAAKKVPPQQPPQQQQQQQPQQQQQGGNGILGSKSPAPAPGGKASRRRRGGGNRK